MTKSTKLDFLMNLLGIFRILRNFFGIFFEYSEFLFEPLKSYRIFLEFYIPINIVNSIFYIILKIVNYIVYY